MIVLQVSSYWLTLRNTLKTSGKSGLAVATGVTLKSGFIASNPKGNLKSQNAHVESLSFKPGAGLWREPLAGLKDPDIYLKTMNSCQGVQKPSFIYA